MGLAMGLFPTWRGMLYLPPLPERRLKVGGNWIVQQPFRGGMFKASLSPSTHSGHEEIIVTGVAAPFDILLRRLKGAHRLKTDIPVVTIAGALESGLAAVVPAEWDSLGQLEYWTATPEGARADWAGRFVFATADEEAGAKGLRAPQIGALHAIAAHFAVGRSFDAATIVLPTGTGKTETMLAAQIYQRPERTLVLVPSDALRSQIAKKFITLGILSEVGAIPAELAGPRVAVLASGVRSVEDAEVIIAEANVIVTLPDTLRASDPEARGLILAACSDLMIDEAHHVSAASWASVREAFVNKRIVQFTATPFRQDSKRIDGKIIFNYRLGDAQAAGYYRPINLVTVEEYGEAARRDMAIAEAALGALKRDLAAKRDHILMARTRSKQRADEIHQIYLRLAPELKPLVVYSGAGQTLANRTAVQALLDREQTGSRIIVCVDMLGEGFDLPNLKVAALHDAHKSLAITLQFIGRFTRSGPHDAIGEATVAANIADEETEQKLAALYAEGADWDQIIKRLSEERIDEELELQDVVETLRKRGDLHAHLSLWNLRPALSAQFYRTTCEEWTPTEFVHALAKNAESWHAISEDGSLLIAVVYSESEVGWGDFQDLFDTAYDLAILKWNKASGALYAYASDYNRLRIERMADIVTGQQSMLVQGTPIFNILNNVELPLVKSLGSSRIGAISFTSYFGPNVTDGLAQIEKAESELNNIACIGYEDGDRVLWGCTQRKGKAWQQKHGPLTEWLEWAARTYAKISDQSEDVANITRDFLRPVRIERAYPSHPIAAQWGEQAQRRFNDRQFVIFGTSEVPFYLVDLEIDSVQSNSAIDIAVSTEGIRSVYRLSIGGEFTGGYEHAHVSGPTLSFKKANAAPVLLADYLRSDPFIIRYADGTYSYNCYHIPAKLDAGQYSRDRLEAWDWTGIPLNKESMHKTADRNTIQYRSFETIAAEHDLIFNDDGPGEAADLVCLKDLGESRIRLTLVHCKNAHEGRVSGDIRNFYTICGQAQKSIAVKHGGVPTLYHDLKRRQEQWHKQGATRFLKGDMKLLSYFKEKARRSALDFEVVIVQPGASANAITSDALRLLATTELFLTKTTEAKLRVIVSS